MDIFTNLVEKYGNIIIGLITILGVFYAYKSFKLSSDKNDYEEWCSLPSNLELLRFGNRISQQLFINSISFLRKNSFGKTYPILKIALKNNIDLFELKKLLSLNRKGYFKFKINKDIEIYWSNKTKSKNSVLFFQKAKSFKIFSWIVFILFHLWILYTSTFSKINIIIINPDKSISLEGVFYLPILAGTEIYMLKQIDIREQIEKFSQKFNIKLNSN